jgi:DNA-binding HxlR family transcriptional regulator
MAASRRYKLLCPIARALDRIGDRWTLLILRDLHAGPARFSDLQTGLTGIAANLLTDRLQQLADDGLVEKRGGEYGVMLYALTPLGARTRDLLFELAMFGGRFEPDPEPRRPGNLRTIAVTLTAACQRVLEPDMAFKAALNVDDEMFTMNVADGRVDIRYAPASSPDVTLTTSYQPMVDTADGNMTPEEFAANHSEIVAHTPGKDAELMGLLGAAMSMFRD